MAVGEGEATKGGLMRVELTIEQAEMLIAVLAYAEGCALASRSEMLDAIKALKPARSALVVAYLEAKMSAATVES